MSEMLSTSGIYKITINNKMYVGFAKNLEYRKSRHYNALTGKKHINPYLQNAFIKYNEFKFEIIEECAEDVLEEKEIYWIAELNTFKGEGYNLTAGGDGWLGGIHTDETKRKIGESSKNRSVETRRKISEAAKGRTHTAEAKRKISEALKGIPCSDETKRKIGEGNKGKSTKHTLDVIKETCLKAGRLNKSQKVLGYSSSGAICKRLRQNNIKVKWDGNPMSLHSKIIGFETFIGE